MKNMLYIAVITILIELISGQAYFTDYEYENNVDAPAKICGIPSDLVFILDGSSSIWPTHFRKQLDFVNSVVNEFNIENDGTGTRVGVMTFSDEHKVEIQFHLNEHYKRKELNKAISRIRQPTGNTHTGLAIRKARHEMFLKRYGARWDDDEVQKIAIIMTDGRSTDHVMTQKEALLTKMRGIRIMVIGIGLRFDRKAMAELDGIANRPLEDNRFMVDSFDVLAGIKEQLAISACKVKAKIPPWKHCGAKMQSDVAFILGEGCTKSPEKTALYSQFVKNVTKHFEMGPNRIQVAMVPDECTVPGFKFNRFHDLQSMHDHLDNANNFNLDSTPARIARATNVIFTGKHGSRSYARKLAIVLLDENPERKGATVAAARAAKKRGIDVVAIAIGDKVNDRLLKSIASTPSKALRFTNQKQINKKLRKLLYRIICKGTTEADQDEIGGYYDHKNRLQLTIPVTPST